MANNFLAIFLFFGKNNKNLLKKYFKKFFLIFLYCKPFKVFILLREEESKNFKLYHYSIL